MRRVPASVSVRDVHCVREFRNISRTQCTSRTLRRQATRRAHLFATNDSADWQPRTRHSGAATNEAEFAPQRQVLGKAAASTGSMAPNTYVRADAARAKVLREEGEHHGHSRQRRTRPRARGQWRIRPHLSFRRATSRNRCGPEARARHRLGRRRSRPRARAEPLCRARLER